MDENINPDQNKMDEEALLKNFNCVRCSIRLTDVKLLKTHYWKVHIWKDDVQKANQKLTDPNNIKSEEPKRRAPLKSKNRRDASEEEIAKKKRKLTNTKKKDPSNFENEQQESLSEIDLVREKVEKLTDEEIKDFNLENIDEAKLFERTKNLFPCVSYNKLIELQKGGIGWASWKFKGNHIMWPCQIEKFVKDSTGSMKVYFKYYEVSGEFGKIPFKFPPVKVELFFRTDDHFELKKLGASVSGLRYDFFVCYTKALKDYMEYLNEKEKGLNNTEASESMLETTSISNLLSRSIKIFDSTLNKYLVNGKTYSIDEIKEIAAKSTSESQILINQNRIEESKKLVDVLLTPECEDYLVSIFMETVDCARHTNYLKGDLMTRRKMKFCSPGPLVEDDQHKLAVFINGLCKNKYLNKPINLTTYEYDVLYPEAVIWGLRKLEDLTYKKAENKYKKGFKRTDEEKLKQRCNEILNNLPKAEQNEDSNSTYYELENLSEIPDTNTKDVENNVNKDNLEATCNDQEESCFEDAKENQNNKYQDQNGSYLD